MTLRVPLPEDALDLRFILTTLGLDSIGSRTTARLKKFRRESAICFFDGFQAKAKCLGDNSRGY